MDLTIKYYYINNYENHLSGKMYYNGKF